MHYGGGAMGFMWLWWLGGILLVVVLVWAVLRAISRSGSSRDRGRDPGAGGPVDSPEEILRRRYASGEIDRSEYEERLRNLRRR
jgi:putative membrane protein